MENSTEAHRVERLVWAFTVRIRVVTQRNSVCLQGRVTKDLYAQSA